jgi:hypothetical protein
MEAPMDDTAVGLGRTPANLGLGLDQQDIEFVPAELPGYAGTNYPSSNNCYLNRSSLFTHSTHSLLLFEEQKNPAEGS